MHTLIKNWWLLALCGILDAIYSFTNLVAQGPDGTLGLREFMGPATVRNMGGLALAAGLCTFAAGILSSGRGKSWLLALNGLALSTFGLLCFFWTKGKHSFLPVALLFAVMAMSIGTLAVSIAPALRRQVTEKWFLSVAGATSIAFALAFVVLGLRWIRLEPLAYLIWMSSYFAFSAICMLSVGLRLRGLRATG